MRELMRVAPRGALRTWRPRACHGRPAHIVRRERVCVTARHAMPLHVTDSFGLDKLRAFNKVPRCPSESPTGVCDKVRRARRRLDGGGHTPAVEAGTDEFIEFVPASK